MRSLSFDREASLGERARARGSDFDMRRTIHVKSYEQEDICEEREREMKLVNLNGSCVSVGLIFKVRSHNLNKSSSQSNGGGPKSKGGEGKFLAYMYRG